MKEILTTHIDNEPLELGRQHGELTMYDGLSTPVTYDVITLSTEHRVQIEQYAMRSADVYGDEHGIPEPTLVQTRDALPSYIVRVDCTIRNGVIVPYEMEDSPSGQGITDLLHQRITGHGIARKIIEHYEEQIGDVPHILISDHRSQGTDDALIVGKDRCHFGTIPAIDREEPVIVKAIPGNIESHRPFLHLQSQAIAPLVTEGDKSYAERSGELTTVETPENLIRDGDGQLVSQVVKARLGSMAMGVSIYLTSEDRSRFGKKGTVTASRLVSDLASFNERSGALVQTFVPPLQLDNPEGRSNAILRVFVLLSRSKQEIQAEAIGGGFVARRELIVHGASNAVGGIVCV